MTCALRFVVFISISALCIADDDIVSNKKFPTDFKFGVATSAFQIEGAWNEDGKGESVWDNETHSHPEWFPDQANADVAADSYHQYKEDIAALKLIGAQAYRFSIAWARILPNGDPKNVNKLGVQYYKNLIALLKENDIEPFVTMYHGQLPQALQDLGGWINDTIVDLFTDYAKVLFEEFGEDVKYWMTVNEPMYVCAGYAGGGIPHINGTGVLDYVCTHNIIKAHVKVYRTYEKEYKDTQTGKISMAINSNWIEPASNSTEDQEAAERALQFGYGWYANPLVFGTYPQVMIDRIANRSILEGFSESRLPEFTAEEQEYNRGTLDFLCVNTYTTSVAKHQDDAEIGTPSKDADTSVNVYAPETGAIVVGEDHKIYPWGARKLLNWLSDTYGQPEIIISENGFSDHQGLLNDTDTRGRYIKLYLSNIQDAMYEDGVNVTAYMVWSLLDTFEWYSGYTIKMGLFRIDYEAANRTRTARDSAYYYQKVCSTRCLVDECVEEFLISSV